MLPTIPVPIQCFKISHHRPSTTQDGLIEAGWSDFDSAGNILDVHAGIVARVQYLMVPP